MPAISVPTLTQERSKPAVTFAGRYRIIDFVLSNFANSGVLRMKVLTQYKSESLNTHITRGWRLSSMLGQFVEPCVRRELRPRRLDAGRARAHARRAGDGAACASGVIGAAREPPLR